MSEDNPADVVTLHRNEEEECVQPAMKKLKREESPPTKTNEKLELRLGGILCCAVCLDLPTKAVFQCTNGHLMCAGCFTHLLADARLRDETATCPNCRIEISKSLVSRNLAVEKAVSELPARCQFCSLEFPRNSLYQHEREACDERPATCKFSRIGCPWRGPWHEGPSHEVSCQHPSHSGAAIMDVLREADRRQENERHLYDHIFEFLSFEKINFNDLQMKPYRTDEFVHKLFYETSRFSAFSNQWVIKARVNDSQRDPTLSCERNLAYQLILKTKISSPLSLHFLILNGPFGDMRVNPKIYSFEFTEEASECPFFLLPLPDSAECNRHLAAKAINFRLIMFLVSK